MNLVVDLIIKIKKEKQGMVSLKNIIFTLFAEDKFTFMLFIF